MAQEILELCKAIGIYTLEDLAMFQRQEGGRADNLLDALRDYEKEIEE